MTAPVAGDGPTPAPPAAARPTRVMPQAPPGPSSAEEHGGLPAALLRWLRAGRSVARIAVLSATAGLLFWALVPVLVGWEPTLVVSGSMVPAVRAGDIVVVAPIDRKLLATRTGMIVLVDDPAVPGGLLLHRVVGHAPDGTLITKGDANAENDRATVPLDNVHGAARLRVPYTGLAVLWLRSGQPVPLVALALVLTVLAWPDRDRAPARPHRRSAPAGRRRR